MQRASEELFAGTALSFEQDGHVSRRGTVQ